MSRVRLGGYVTIDIADYEDEIEVNVEDVSALMDLASDNNITNDEILDFINDSQIIGMEDVNTYISEIADHEDLKQIVDHCLMRLMQDYSLVHSQMIDTRRELRVAKEAANVSEIRPSC